jgi:hypothetical protein
MGISVTSHESLYALGFLRNLPISEHIEKLTTGSLKKMPAIIMIYSETVNDETILKPNS